MRDYTFIDIIVVKRTVPTNPIGWVIRARIDYSLPNILFLCICLKLDR